MRRKLPLIVVFVLTFLIIQCNPTGLSLFPEFLTSVTHLADVAPYFQATSGDSFAIHAQWSGASNTDIIYITQILPDGQRKLAVFDGQLVNLAVYGPAPEAGAKSADMGDGSFHVTGNLLCNTSVRPPSFSPITQLLNPDYPLAAKTNIDPADAYELWMDNTQSPPPLAYYNYSYNKPTQTFSSPPPTPSSLFVGPVNQSFALEAAQVNYVESTEQLCLVFRDVATDQGYVMRSMLPPMNYPLYPLQPSRIVPGSVQFTPDGDFIAQSHDGYLRRYNLDGHSNDKVLASDYIDLILTYGNNSSMYLLNPATLKLFKSRAWWMR